jgi:hypothetical protein
VKTIEKALGIELTKGVKSPMLVKKHTASTLLSPFGSARLSTFHFIFARRFGEHFLLGGK